jgi:beta-lactamase regulating signal transducer with metallopeptidase domain
LPHALPKAVSLDLPSRSSTVNTLLTTAIDAASNAPLSEPKTQANAIGWREMACFLYACVSGILLLRIAIGLLKARRLLRAARPFRDGEIGDAVLTSGEIATPFSFGSFILLPEAAANWPAATLDAVLAHERRHIEGRDFGIQCLAAINRALFWINPLSWWLKARLAALAETISDGAAVDSAGDAPRYAEILLEMAKTARPIPFGVAMARGPAVAGRIERILAGAIQHARIGRRERLKLAIALIPLALAAAWPALRLSAEPANDSPLAAYAGDYLMQSKMLANAVLSITAEGDHLYAQLAAQPKIEVFPDGPQSFVYHFAGDGKAPADSVTLTQGGQDYIAARIPAASAQALEAQVAAKLAQQRQPGKQISIDPNIFDNYVGRYETGNGDFVVTRDGDRFYVKLGNQPTFEVFAESPHDFFYTVVAAQITFVTGPDGKATKLVLHQNGMDIAATRVE